MERARGYAQHAHDAVAAGLDAYLTLLDAPDPEAQEWAFALLCVLSVRAVRIVPLLLARLRAETEPGLRARLVDHLAFGLAGLPLDAGKESAAELLQTLARSAETEMVRFAAAVGLAHLLGADTPSCAADVLRDAVAHPAGLNLDVDLEGNDPPAGEALVVEQAQAALSRI